MGRGVFSTSLLMSEFLHYTREAPIESAKGPDYARVDDFDHVTQRAKDPKHVAEIADYIRACIADGKPIVLPGVVLNCDIPGMTVFVLAGANKRQYAALCVSPEMLLRLIDGMHRKYAALEVLNPKSPSDRLNAQGEKTIKDLLLPAMVTFEEDYSQLRDDFAVIAKAKEIAASLQIAFRRNGINDFSADVLKATPFLHHHTNVAATQTAPKSAHAWTFSVVGRAMRRLVSGKRSSDELALSETLEKLRKESPLGPQSLSFDEFAREWWLAVQNAVPVYTAMAGLPKAPTGYMADLRERPDGENLILLNVGGLEIFAALGHDLWKNGWRTKSDINVRAMFIKTFDWRGVNQIWLTNLVPYAGASVTQKDAAVTEACAKLIGTAHMAEGRPSINPAAAKAPPMAPAPLAAVPTGTPSVIA